MIEIVIFHSVNGFGSALIVKQIHSRRRRVGSFLAALDVLSILKAAIEARPLGPPRGLQGDQEPNPYPCLETLHVW